MLAPRRKPTIRRVRDWDPLPAMRAPRVPLDVVLPIAKPYYEEDEEDEKATLARVIPMRSEVRALLDDPEETLAYIRTVQASIPDGDAALDSLVAVYEDRVARIEKERVRAAEIAAQPKTKANAITPRIATMRNIRPADRAVLELQPHVWKIVYSAICVWGLLQLALTR